MDLLLSPFTLGAFATGIAASLALPLLLSPSQADRARRWLGLLLAGAAGTALCIALKNGPLAGHRATVDAAEKVLALLVGPLLLGFVRSALPGVAPPLGAWSLAPAGCAALWAGFGLSPPIEWVLLHQFGCTALAARVWLVAGSAERAGEWAGWVSRVLFVMLALHASQAVRLLLRADPRSRNVVAGSMASLLLLPAAAGFARGLPGAGAPEIAHGGRYRRARLKGEAVDTLLARLDHVMDELRRYRDPGLDAARLAAELRITPHQLAQLLNVHRGTSLAEYLSRLRVERFQALLADPSQDRYTIEALGSEAGFSSRSALYSAFSRYAGTTPLEYRARVRGA